MASHSPVRVRFAPSPTGHLHIGGLRTAFFNWLFARAHHGTFLIRVEDTDLERSLPAYIESQLASLEWAGIASDEPIVIQSTRIERHKEVIAQLLAAGKAYYCACTPEQIADRLYKKDAAQAAYGGYDGYCADKNVPMGAYPVRFRVSRDQESIAWDDLIRGHVSFPTTEIDDFIIARSDGSPMYNFVVVVDDADMHISHVIRGEDHVSNTPKQIVLYNACSFTLPQFAHVPMILGADGTRLSKRDAATSVLDYKTNGFLPQALLNYLVRLGWSHGDQEIFTVSEMIRYFRLEDVGKKGAIFDMTKLEWINGVYIRAMSAEEIIQYLKQEQIVDIATVCSRFNHAQLCIAVDLYKERVKTLAELVAELQLLHNDPMSYYLDDVEKWIADCTAADLTEVVQRLEQVEPFTVELVQNAIKTMVSERGLKLVTVAQPIRIALVGKSASPGVFELLALLGKERSLERLCALITIIKK